MATRYGGGHEPGLTGRFLPSKRPLYRRLRGRAVAVGGAQRGIILPARREARRMGPLLIVVAAHFDLHERFPGQIPGLCRETAPRGST